MTRPVTPGLLGTYPVPELHLVGAPIPDNPRSPIRWRPTPAPLQYGIDYTFTHPVGRERDLTDALLLDSPSPIASRAAPPGWVRDPGSGRIRRV